MDASRAAGPRQPPPCRCSERTSSPSGAATWGQQLRRWLADVIVTLAYEPPLPSLAARISQRVSPNPPAHPPTAHPARSQLPPSASPGAPGGSSASDESCGEAQVARGALPRPRVWLPRPLRAVAVALLAGGAAGYGAAMRARWEMYQRGWRKRSRVGVAVISVGNITWGGNGKTPMVASTALHLLSLLNTAPHSQPASQPAMSATTTIPTSSSPTPTTPPSPTTANTSPSNSSSPTPPPRAPSILILSRGYAGGDEARMLQRQLSGHPVIIAVGRKRADVARRVIGQFGAWRGWGQGAAEGGKHEGRKEEGRKEEVVGHGGVDGGGGAVGPVAAVIMDDGMQHWALHRDLDIVMLNAVSPHAQGQEQIQAQADSYAQRQSGCSSPWGNGKLVPRGPMRERLEALQRADVVVIHNADLAPPACVAALAAQLQHHMPPHALLLHSSLRPLHLLSPSPCSCASSPLHSLPTPSDDPFTCSPPTPASPAGPASPACHEPRGTTALKGAQGRGNSHLLLCHREGGAGEGGGEEGEAGGGDRVVACASVAGRDAVCLSAIGSPDALQATLQTQLHLRRVVSIALPDHSPFSLQVSCSHSPAKPATTATCPCACMHGNGAAARYQLAFLSFYQLVRIPFPSPCPLPACDFSGRRGSILSELGITPTTLISLVSPLLSIPCCLLLRATPSTSARHAIGALTGLFLALSAFGPTIWAHYAVLLTFAYSAMCLFRKRCGIITLLGTFAYLIVCHVVYDSGSARRDQGIDFAGTLMMVTLKLTSCAFDYQDGQYLSDPVAADSAASAAANGRPIRGADRHLCDLPSPLEFMGYMFCGGLHLTGPYFEMKRYLEWARHEGVWSRSARKAPFLVPLLTALAWAVPSGLLHLMLKPRMNVGITSDPAQVWSVSYVARWGYAILATYAVRTKIYYVWMVAEGSMVASGLGFSGWVPQRGAAASNSSRGSSRARGEKAELRGRRGGLAGQADCEPVREVFGERCVNGGDADVPALTTAAVTGSVILSDSDEDENSAPVIRASVRKTSSKSRPRVALTAAVPQLEQIDSDEERERETGGKRGSGEEREVEAQEASWKRARNIDIVGVEAVTGMHGFAKNWNVRTGEWLRTYIYERVTPEGQKPGVLPLILTVCTSAVWHGVYIGDFFFALNMAWLIMGSRIIYRYQRTIPASSRLLSLTVAMLHSLYSFLGANYSAQGFILLSASQTLVAYSGMGWVGTLLPLIPVALSQLGKLRGARIAEVASTRHSKVQ
ncbi:unnamed protein product [Closterium sp. NIES-64]|nr:unnamed protein product [Closterium sp. NIES-64]